MLSGKVKNKLSDRIDSTEQLILSIDNVAYGEVSNLRIQNRYSPVTHLVSLNDLLEAKRKKRDTDRDFYTSQHSGVQGVDLQGLATKKAASYGLDSQEALAVMTKELGAQRVEAVEIPSQYVLPDPRPIEQDLLQRIALAETKMLKQALSEYTGKTELDKLTMRHVTVCSQQSSGKKTIKYKDRFVLTYWWDFNLSTVHNDTYPCTQKAAMRVQYCEKLKHLATTK